MSRVFCFGEVLWDVLPAGIFLGGAPLNVAFHLVRHNVSAAMISAVGEDFLGIEARERMALGRVDNAFVSPTGEAPTGTVKVRLDANGQPTYAIRREVAWDWIPVTAPLVDRVARADALVFGSLAGRTSANREGLLRLLDREGPLKCFDVNLRHPHDDIDRALDLAARADLVKLNVGELAALTGRTVEGEAACADAAASLGDRTGVDTVCVTRGAQGALVWSRDGMMTAPAPEVRVRDAVGAGDAFMASLLAAILAGESPADRDVLAAACRVGAFVASRDGAVPEYDPDTVATG